MNTLCAAAYMVGPVTFHSTYNLSTLLGTRSEVLQHFIKPISLDEIRTDTKTLFSWEKYRPVAILIYNQHLRL